MRDGKHCPACGVDIGVRPVWFAPLPNLIRCPRCKARLSYEGIVAAVVVLVLLAVAVTAAAIFVTSPIEGNQRLLAFAAVALGVWVPVELAGALYLRANKTLVCRSGQPAAERDDTSRPDPPSPR